MKALILNNQIVDVSETEFEVHESMTWVDCPDECDTTWSYTDGVFSEPEAPAPLTYSQLRAAAYPSIKEQLDMQYWDSVNGTTTWADAIAAVKAANPKPE
jgi:hypothetical protein